MHLIIGGSDCERVPWVRRDGHRERLLERLNHLAAAGKDSTNPAVREVLHELNDQKPS